MLDSLYVNVPYSFSPLALLTLLVALGVIALGIFALVREQASPVSVVFFIATWSISLWLFGYSWMYCAIDVYLATWWAKAGFIGVVCIPAAIYHFVALVMEDYEKVRKKVLAAWVMAAFFVTLTLSTNLLFDNLYLHSWGFYPLLDATSLPFLLYFFGLILLAFRSTLRVFRRSPRNSATMLRARTLVALFVLALVASLDFLPSFGLSWYPFGFVSIFFCLLIATRSVVHYRFKAITPAFAAREILRTMNQALLVLDSDGIVRLVNEATCALFGYREEDLVGKEPLAAMAHCGDFAGKLKTIVESGAVRQQEILCEPRNGPRRTLSVSASVMNNTAGERIATVCMISDITGRKRTEEDREGLITELREAYTKLQAVDRLKSEFVSIVSHELRTPLTTIKAFSELILMRPDMEERKKKTFLAKINTETDRLKRLISDLLDLSRIESGSMQWRMDKVSIEVVVESSLASLSPLFEDKGLRLSSAFHGLLPSLRGDSDRLIQVVTNILSNAMKFTPAGGAVHIAVGRHDGRDEILVRISDTGIGIPASDLDMIFEKFRRSGDTLTSAIDGTGLGLAIARQIIDHHGGRIWAESSQGKGSVFSFTLPVPPPETASAEAGP